MIDAKYPKWKAEVDVTKPFIIYDPAIKGTDYSLWYGTMFHKIFRKFYDAQPWYRRLWWRIRNWWRSLWT